MPYCKEFVTNTTLYYNYFVEDSEFILTNKFILNACDVGTSNAVNRGVIEGCDLGLLKSINLVVNGDFFQDVVDKVLPSCPDIDCGVQLNITRGNSLCTDVLTLTDDKRKFNNSFLKIFINSCNPKNGNFLSEVEREFRRQIETAMSKAKITHISSTDNVHAIPKIFEIVCRLANEYGIKYVKSCYEKIYIVPDIFRHFKADYYKNILKALLLNMLSLFNDSLIYKYNLKTNDYYIGGIYEGMCDSLAISYGISALKYNNIIVETGIRPCRYDEGTIDNYFDEFLVTKNQKLKNKIEAIGFEITNYAEN